MRPDGSVSNWLSRLQGSAGTVVFALDESGDALRQHPPASADGDYAPDPTQHGAFL